MEFAPMPDPETVEIDEGVTVSSPDAPEQDVKPAEDDGPASMADAVAEAMKGEGEPSDPGTEDVEGEDGGEPAAQAPTADDTQDAKSEGEPEEQEALPEGDPTDEELKDYSQKANARIRDLVSQRNEAREAAQQVEPIMDFLNEHQIPRDDLDIMLDLTARLRHGDFAGFLQGVTPYINLAQQYTGQVLPPDLQQQVNQGYVSPEIAKELSQSRAQLQVSQNNVQEAQRTAQIQQAENRAGTIRSAIDKWEAQTRQSDPDYELKADMVRRTSQALMQENGIPQTPQDAIQVAKAAYDEVNKQTQNFRPQKKPTTPSPNATGQSGGSAPTAEPTSLMEAAMQGLQNANQG
jgi:hypothetical protein